MQLPSFNLVSAAVLDVHSGPLADAENSRIVRSLSEAGQALGAWAARPPAPAMTVDLLGHSTRDHRLLRLGGTVIDALDPLVLGFFEELAQSRVLPAMNAVAVRLLGCETAVSVSGLRTLRLLAEVLDLPVFGARKRLARAHHTERGFDSSFDHLLVEAAPRRLRAPRCLFGGR